MSEFKPSDNATSREAWDLVRSRELATARPDGMALPDYIEELKAALLRAVEIAERESVARRGEPLPRAPKEEP